MAFSYNSSQLSEPLNRLRFLVQDTGDAGHFLEDEEITYSAEQEPNLYRVAAGLCRAIAAKLSKTPNLDDVTIKFDADKRASTYIKLAETYDQKADELDDSMQSPTSSGLNLPTFSDREPAFTRGLHFTDN